MEPNVNAESDEQARHRSWVRWLAGGLCVDIVVQWYTWSLLLFHAFGYPEAASRGVEVSFPDPQVILGLKSGIFISVIIFYGASHMFSCKRYGLSLFSCILAIFPVFTPFLVSLSLLMYLPLLLGALLGACSIYVLRRPVVQELFEEAEE